ANAPSPAPRSSTRSPGRTCATRNARRAANRSGRTSSGTARHTASRQGSTGVTVPHDGAHYAPRGVNLLAVNDTDVPGERELRLLDALQRMREHGWESTVSTPGDRPLAHGDFPWVHLDVGGLGQGEGAR